MANDHLRKQAAFITTVADITGAVKDLDAESTPTTRKTHVELAVQRKPRFHGLGALPEREAT